MRDPAWVGLPAIGVTLTRLPDHASPSTVPPMPEVAYIAELSAADYALFRERDPKLPASHAAWVEAAGRRVRAARSTGARVVLHPIAFADFEAFLTGIGLTDFGAGSRDCYATDMATARKVAGRR